MGLGELAVIVGDSHVVATLAVHKGHDHGLGSPTRRQNDAVVKNVAHRHRNTVKIPALKVISSAPGIGQAVNAATGRNAQRAHIAAAVGVKDDIDQLGPIGIEGHGRLNGRVEVVGQSTGLVDVPALELIAFALGVIGGHNGVAMGDLTRLDGRAAAAIKGDGIANVVPVRIEIKIAVDLAVEVVRGRETLVGIPAAKDIALALRVDGTRELATLGHVIDIEKRLAVCVEELDEVDVLVPLGNKLGVLGKHGRDAHLIAGGGIPTAEDMVGPGGDGQAAQARAFLQLDGGDIAAARRVKRDGHELGPLGIDRGVRFDGLREIELSGAGRVGVPTLEDIAVAHRIARLGGRRAVLNRLGIDRDALPRRETHRIGVDVPLGIEAHGLHNGLREVVLLGVIAVGVPAREGIAGLAGVGRLYDGLAKLNQGLAKSPVAVHEVDVIGQRLPVRRQGSASIKPCRARHARLAVVPARKAIAATRRRGQVAQ